MGLWLALERAELTPAQRRNAWLGVMIPFTLWLALIWGSAINGVFRGGFAPLPLLPFAIFLPVIIGTPIMLLSKRMGQVLDAMPAGWLIALQTYRVFGSVFLIGSAARAREAAGNQRPWPADKVERWSIDRLIAPPSDRP